MLVYAGLRWSTLVYPGRSSLRRGCGPPGPPAGARPPLVPWPRLLPRAASLGASRARHGGREFVNYLTRIRPLRNGVECYSKSPSATVTPAHSAAAHAMGTPVASEAWAYPGLPRSSMVYPSLRWSTLVYVGLRTLVYLGLPWSLGLLFLASVFLRGGQVWVRPIGLLCRYNPS